MKKLRNSIPIHLVDFPHGVGLHGDEPGELLVAPGVLGTEVIRGQHQHQQQQPHRVLLADGEGGGLEAGHLGPGPVTVVGQGNLVMIMMII